MVRPQRRGVTRGVCSTCKERAAALTGSLLEVQAQRFGLRILPGSSQGVGILILSRPACSIAPDRQPTEIVRQTSHFPSNRACSLDPQRLLSGLRTSALVGGHFRAANICWQPSSRSGSSRKVRSGRNQPSGAHGQSGAPTISKFFGPSYGLKYLSSHSPEVCAGENFGPQPRTSSQTKTGFLIR